MNEQLKQTLNVAELQGTLVQSSLETKVNDKGETFISGSVELNVGSATEECFVQLKCYAKEKTKAGKPNPLYQGLANVIKLPTSAQDGNETAGTVSFYNARIVDNSFYSGQTGKMIENWALEAGSVNIVTRLAPHNNSLSVQGVVDVIKEVLDKDGEPTGELRVELLTVGWAERVARIPFFITKPEGVKYIEENWNPGDLVTVYGELNYEQRVTEIAQETAFGETAVKSYTDTVRRLVINSGTSAISEDEHTYTRSRLLTLRAAYLQDLEEKGLAKNAAPVAKTENPYLDF